MKAEYEFYTSAYRGALSKDEFLRYGVQAEVFLDDLISYKREEELSAENLRKVQLAFCALCDGLAKEETANIKSEENDGVSVTYESMQGTREERLRNSAVPFLMGTGLLYRGCR